ncbi:carboxypeptidase-like regulatory domain-containing protein [Calycomorphotria hydatis]|uniref:Carboxypeptidase regulatory-like domain-containing protein n=1 Tax=Calycomorphotria hydatis TaxID=2528027 RepID=A0A517TDI5_9PLAN|nr:carboxypeptidase-like regulatory domain-containing protein [Calycomorphotria hydatis]QDT66436.1 hypothetical protein V22_37030 [Calycomorphotria hydatis]
MFSLREKCLLQGRGWIVVIALTAMIGCGEEGPEVAKVTGTVTLDGEPLPYADITFIPKQGGRNSLATTDDAGNYSLTYTLSQKGALVGEHKVVITSVIEADAGEGDDAKAIKGRPEKLPAKYNSASELTANVQSEENSIDFALTTN